jgi:hypothetical protein
MKKLLLLLCIAVTLLSIRAIAFDIKTVKTGKDRVKIGGNIIVKEGETVKNAVAVFGNVTVNGGVEGNATAVFGSVNVRSKGSVKQNATSVRGTVAISDGGKVFGDVTEINACHYGVCALPAAFGAGLLGFLSLLILLILFGILALGALFAALFPKYCEDAYSIIDRNLLKTFLWGLMASIIVFPVTLILILTIVGILFIPLEAVLLVLSMSVGYLLAGHYFGKKLIIAVRGASSSPVWEMLLGLFVLWLATLVPFLGIAVKLFAVLLGFGAVLVSIFRLCEKNENSN